MVTAQKRLSFKLGVAPLLIITFLFLIFIIFRFGDNQAFFSPTLLFVLNTIFFTVIGFLVSIVSAKSYLSEGAINVLFLGLATTVSGIAASIAGWTSNISANHNQ
jgi:hypothetical protein